MLNILINNSSSIGYAFISVVAFLGAIIIALSMHEFAHGLVAYWNGDLTAKMNGRLTLNPLKHLDIMGTLLLIVAGFGWAKPVPVNSNNFKNIRVGIFTVSIAGVTMNLILSILSFICLLIMYAIIQAVGIVNSAFIIALAQLFEAFFLYGIVINLTLMAFNLLPIYPLDGFHIVETFTRYDNKYCVFMRRYGSMILFGVLIIGSILSSIGSAIGGTFGAVLQYFDIIGLYINTVSNAFISIFAEIFGAIFI